MRGRVSGSRACLVATAQSALGGGGADRRHRRRLGLDGVRVGDVHHQPADALGRTQDHAATVERREPRRRNKRENIVCLFCTDVQHTSHFWNDTEKT